MLAGIFATGRYTSFDDKGWAIIPGGGLVPAQKSDTWMAAYIGEQRLWVDPCDEQRFVQLYGYLGFSDTETSPFEWTGALSLEVFGPLASRPKDRTGIAYFYSGLNSDFENLFRFTNPISDVHGGEVYYNAEITPWFHLTFDLQAIEPAEQRNDTALVLGARAKIDF